MCESKNVSETKKQTHTQRERECVCVCVYEKEREREGESKLLLSPPNTRTRITRMKSREKREGESCAPFVVPFQYQSAIKAAKVGRGLGQSKIQVSSVVAP